MPALADYTDLRIAVGDQVNNRSLSDVMSRLVQQAEGHLNRKLRCRQQITSDTLIFVDGSADLPSDFLEMISVFDAQGCQMHAGSLARTNLTGSQYSWYAIDGSSVLIKGLSGQRDVRYFAALPSLTVAPTATNWLLAGYPEVYLYAVSLEATKFMRDAEQTLAMQQLLQGAIDDLKVDDDRARWSNTVVRVQGITP
jgi:hypothetical protein